MSAAWAMVIAGVDAEIFPCAASTPTPCAKEISFNKSQIHLAQISFQPIARMIFLILALVLLSGCAAWT
jgi:hypothetical protein